MSKNSSKQNLDQLLDWLSTKKNVKSVTREGGKIKFNSQYPNKKRK